MRLFPAARPLGVLVTLGLADRAACFVSRSGGLVRSLHRQQEHCLREQHQQRRQHQRRHSSPLVSLRMSTIAPPKPPETSVRTGGGGDGDGLRPLTVKQVQQAVSAYQNVCQGDEDQVDLLRRVLEWGEGMDARRLGTRKMCLGLFSSGTLKALAGAEVRWGRGPPNQDVRLVVGVVVPSPESDKRTVGFEMMSALKDMARHNALLFDTSAMQEIPANRIFVLENTLASKEADPEAINPLIRRLKSMTRQTSFVLDDVMEDIGPFWHAFTLGEPIDEQELTFFFRRRFSSMREFEVSWTRPQAGHKNGFGTVNGCLVIDVTGDKSSSEPGRAIGFQLAEKMRADVERALMLES